MCNSESVGHIPESTSAAYASGLVGHILGRAGHGLEKTGLKLSPAPGMDLHLSVRQLTATSTTEYLTTSEIQLVCSYL